VTRGVGGRERSPLSDEVKAELARLPLKACDARVLAELLPRANHLGVPARRLAHRTEEADPRSLFRKSCCRRTYLRGLVLAGGSVSAGPSGYLLEIRPPRGEVRRAASILGREQVFAHWIQPDLGATKLWIHDDATGDPQQAIDFVLRCAEAFALIDRRKPSEGTSSRAASAMKAW
jgi:hypothetical protein